MNKSDILTLYDYNSWANERLLRAATGVTTEQFSASAAISHGSLRGALVHTYAAELVWRLRCQEGLSPSGLPDERDFPTLDSLLKRWREEEKLRQAYLATLQDGDLTGMVSYTTTEGMPYENMLWHLLVHLVNHGTQHRSEAAVVLTGYGHSPGDLDMLFFFREITST